MKFILNDNFTNEQTFQQETFEWQSIVLYTTDIQDGYSLNELMMHKHPNTKHCK